MPVQRTSLEAFNKNKEELKTLKGKVRYSLQNFIVQHRFPPTYNELQQHMIHQFEAISWRTQIQPRLTSDLVEEGMVKKAGKRECKVSGEKIQTWRPTV